MPKRKHTKAAAPRVDKRKGGRMPPPISQAALDAEPLYAWNAERDQRVRQYFEENPRTALKNIATALGFPFHVVKQRARELGLLAKADTVRTSEALCAHGQPIGSNGKAPGYDGPDHCAACHDAVNQAVQSFNDGVSRGEHDAEGYTPAERKAQKKRANAKAPPVAAEPDRPVGDPAAPLAEEPERITVACPQGDNRLVITRQSKNGFVILDGPSEVSYGVGFHGLPICPTHQVEMIAGEPIPIADAMRQVLDSNPQQAKLFDTAKPFNFEGAWLTLESMEDEIDTLTERLEKKLTEVKQLRKQLATKQSQHREARLEFKARRLEKAAQIIAAELAQEAGEEATQPLDSRAHVGDGEGAAQEAGL